MELLLRVLGVTLPRSSRQEIGLATASCYCKNIQVRSIHYKLWLTLFLGSILSLGFWASARTQRPQDSDLAIRARMVVISRQLGVTCTYCHDPSHLRATAKPAYAVALAHIRMVRRMNAERIKGLPKVDCYMCHHGTAKFSYREPIDSFKKSAD